MSTRGCIGRLKARDPPAFEGVYHHWDSYPSGLGRGLFRLRNTHFRGDTGAMLRVLVDEHPAGWSNILDRDFRLKPGFGEADARSGNRPQCYCHGERDEDAFAVTEGNAAASGVEYTYALDGARMLILGAFREDGTKMIGMFGLGDENAVWSVIAEIDLDGPEPDWEKLEIDGAIAAQASVRI